MTAGLGQASVSEVISDLVDYVVRNGDREFKDYINDRHSEEVEFASTDLNGEVIMIYEKII